jgi:hypothetical protein
MTLQRLNQMGYGSVKIRRNGDEYAVYEPSRVRILIDSDGDVDDEALSRLANFSRSPKSCVRYNATADMVGDIWKAIARRSLHPPARVCAVEL